MFNRNFIFQCIYAITLYAIVIGSVYYMIYYHPHVTQERPTELKQEADPGEIYCPYTPQDYEMDYGIDLKEDGYLILDSQGDVSYVPFFDLEDWFQRDNM